MKTKEDIKDSQVDQRLKGVHDAVLRDSSLRGESDSTKGLRLGRGRPSGKSRKPERLKLRVGGERVSRGQIPYHHQSDLDF